MKGLASKAVFVKFVVLEGVVAASVPTQKKVSGPSPSYWKFSTIRVELPAAFSKPDTPCALLESAPSETWSGLDSPAAADSRPTNNTGVNNIIHLSTSPEYYFTMILLIRMTEYSYLVGAIHSHL